MDLGLRGRVYLVSGASTGLGLATARVLAEDGARLVLCARDEQRLTAAAESLGPAEQVLSVAADLASPATADTLVATAMARFARLDGAVVSVGGPPPGSVGTVTDEVWRSCFESVFLGPLRLARAVLGTGVCEGRSITFVLSSSVRSPIAGLGVSNGLRPGLAMAAKALADEYGPAGARVNVLLPGRIDTDRVRSLDEAGGRPTAARREFEALVPLRRYGLPEEFGRAAAFLASPAASYVTGAALAVDGGLTRVI